MYQSEQGERGKTYGMRVVLPGGEEVFVEYSEHHELSCRTSSRMPSNDLWFAEKGRSAYGALGFGADELQGKRRVHAGILKALRSSTDHNRW